MESGSAPGFFLQGSFQQLILLMNHLGFPLTAQFFVTSL